MASNGIQNTKWNTVLSKKIHKSKTLSKLMEQPIFKNGNSTSVFTSIASANYSTWSRVVFDRGNGDIIKSWNFPGDGTVLLYAPEMENQIPTLLSANMFRFCRCCTHGNYKSGYSPNEILHSAQDN